MADPGLPTCSLKEKNISDEIKTAFKGTISVISTDPPCKYGKPEKYIILIIPLSFPAVIISLKHF